MMGPAALDQVGSGFLLTAGIGADALPGKDAGDAFDDGGGGDIHDDLLRLSPGSTIRTPPVSLRRYASASGRRAATAARMLAALTATRATAAAGAAGALW